MARGMNNYSMREEIQEFWEKNDEGGRKEEEKNLLCSLLASAPSPGKSRAVMNFEI